MPLSVFINTRDSRSNGVDEAINQARGAHDAGVRQVWLGQNFDLDAIALAAIIGSHVPGLAVGTSVVPIGPRHPLLVTAAAQTAQAATHGRFSLGLGLGGHPIEQRAFGTTAANTIARLREHLTVVRSVLDTKTVDFQGKHWTAADPGVPLTLPGLDPFPVLVAAMGPRALRVTGELADGTLLYLAGPLTIETFIAPTIRGVAEAGRPEPRIIAMISVAVTDDVEAARAEAYASMGFYDSLPAYQKVMSREGISKAADLAVMGNEVAVTEQLRAYTDAGATEIMLMPLQSDPMSLQRVWNLAAGFRG